MTHHVKKFLKFPSPFSHSGTNLTTHEDNVYTSQLTNSFYGGYTYAAMEVFVDVGWNGLTAEIVVGGSIRNHDDERIYYGFVGMYKVGRKTKRLKQLDEVYLADDLRAFAGLPKRKDNVTPTAIFGRTDSYTLSRQLPGFTYFVEARATMTARHTNDALRLKDEVEVDEYDELPVIEEDN